MEIRLKDICKSYCEALEQKQVLTNINLTLKPSEITCLMGASGIGKTTVAHILAGIVKPDCGEINTVPHSKALACGTMRMRSRMKRFCRQEAKLPIMAKLAFLQAFMSSSKTMVPDQEQYNTVPHSTSMVFQEDRLLEWETALTNVLFVAKSPSVEYAKQLLTQAGLKDSINKRVSELSGGMKRRVSICRALVAEYNLLILDEPFKGLDSGIKPIIVDMIKQHVRPGACVLCITHDASDVELLGGRLVEL